MDRKKALALATATSAAVAGAVLAVGANFGLFGLASIDKAPALPVKVARISSETPAPAEQQVIEETRVIDVPVHVPSPASAPNPATGAEAGASSEDSSGTSGDDDASGVTTATHDSTDDSAEIEDHHDETQATSGTSEPCETHDDGRVECHDHDDD